MTVPAQRAGSRVYLRFCRLAGWAFVLVVAYTVVVKLPTGGFAGDWLHSVVHIVTGVAALHFARGRSVAAARRLTFAVGGVYGVLGVVGWFIDGLLLASALRVPLAAADNLFHGLVGLGAVLAIAIGERRSSPDGSGPPAGRR